MIGIDTSFLVAWAIPEHPAHQQCRRLAEEAASDQRTFALTSGILAANGTVVGTATGADVDAGDSATYSLTDDAGGRFANRVPFDSGDGPERHA